MRSHITWRRDVLALYNDSKGLQLLPASHFGAELKMWLGFSLVCYDKSVFMASQGPISPQFGLYLIMLTIVWQ